MKAPPDNEKRHPVGGRAASDFVSLSDRNNTATGVLVKPPGCRIERIAELILPPPFETPIACRRRNDELAALRQEAAAAFGGPRGWRLAQTSFGPRTLAGGKVWTTEGQPGCRRREWDFPHDYGDHPYCYRWADQRAAAAIAHLYDVPPGLKRWTAQNGLAVELLPSALSWYYPGRCIVAVFTRASNLVIGPWGRT